MKSIFQKPIYEDIYYISKYSNGEAFESIDNKFKEYMNIYETDKEFKLNVNDKICIEREPLTIKEIIKSVDDDSIIYITKEHEQIEDLEYRAKIKLEIKEINEKYEEKELMEEIKRDKLTIESKYSYYKYKYSFIASFIVNLYLLFKIIYN